MKNIRLEIGVVRCKNMSRITNLTKKLVEIDPDMEIECQWCDNDIWDQNRFEFDLFDDVPYIIIIKDIWVPEEKRRQSICARILSKIHETFGVDGLIFAYVGISEREFSPLKYSPKDLGDGRIVIDSAAIIKNLLRYFKIQGYEEVSGYTNSSFSNKSLSSRSIMLFGGPLGCIAKPYMEAYIVLRKEHGYNKVMQIYRNMFYHLITMGEDKNVKMLPVEENEEEKIHTEMDPDTIEWLEKSNPSWYSNYKPNSSDQQSEDYEIAKKVLRYGFSLIGGSEVQFDDPIKDSLTHNQVLIKLTSDNHMKRNVDDESDYALQCYEEFFNEKKNEDLVLMKGFGLCSNGIWMKTSWLYDSRNCTVIDYLDLECEEFLAYVGYIEEVVYELM